ncbi:MAG: hypothetical protein L6437_13100, partial [Kiritimatiellae bacterium]|nr:hypothetical protein [Kiritimatiellia bacterium]
HTPADPIGVKDVRQAQSHVDWVKANRTCTKSTRIVALIESPRTTISEKVSIYAKSLCHYRPEQMKELCETITSVIRRVRAQSAVLSEEKVLEHLSREMIAAKLTPEDVIARLSKEPVQGMTRS